MTTPRAMETVAIPPVLAASQGQPCLLVLTQLRCDALGGLFNAGLLECVPQLCCRFDLNGDGQVNTIDLVLFLGMFGQSVPLGSAGDFNSDGQWTPLTWSSCWGPMEGPADRRQVVRMSVLHSHQLRAIDRGTPIVPAARSSGAAVEPGFGLSPGTGGGSVAGGSVAGGSFGGVPVRHGFAGRHRGLGASVPGASAGLGSPVAGSAGLGS